MFANSLENQARIMFSGHYYQDDLGAREKCEQLGDSTWLNVQSGLLNMTWAPTWGACLPQSCSDQNAASFNTFLSIYASKMTEIKFEYFDPTIDFDVKENNFYQNQKYDLTARYFYENII